MAPGILYVTMQPSPSLPSSQFHDWYNNEHGPLRLRLSPSITNGFRYRALDLPDSASDDSSDLDEWMAIYDLPNMPDLNEPSYLKLRSAPIQSTREQSLRPNIRINRQNFDLVREWKTEAFTPLETLSLENKEDNIIIAATITLKSPDSLGAYEKWFADEHVVMLSKVPGWLRTRRFITSSIDSSAPMRVLNINEFASSAALTSPELKAIAFTPAAKDMMDTHIKNAERRIWQRYYTFGPAPRDLSALANSGIPSFSSPASFSRLLTFPTGESKHGMPAIESYVSLPSNTRLPYRLEGSPDPNAPVIVLVNSILVNWGIWDSFVASFLSSQANKQYRILRYNPRGRYSNAGENVTIDMLASDLMALLDALRIRKAEAVVGVSLGGATALAAALTYPTRIERFMSCDTSASAPAGNRKAWEERIQMSEGEGAVRKSASAGSSAEEIVGDMDLLQEGEAIVGDQLAEATAKRWFPAPSWEASSPVLAECQRVQAAVANNSLAGFKAGVQALWEYDYENRMASYQGKGMFLVGGEDGKLPQSMKAMAAGLGKEGATLVVVEGAGHLPMVQEPGEVVKAVEQLLGM